MAVSTSRGSNIQRAGSSGSLVEIIDRILDKGLVIDAWVRISLVGIELITIEARVVVASVDTYLKYAEAIGATQLAARPQGAVESAPAAQQVTAPHHLSEEDVLRYLQQHPDGLPISEMEDHFQVPRSRIEDVVNHLLDDHRVGRDEQRQVLFPVQ
jgi:hypothetical protein